MPRTGFPLFSFFLSSQDPLQIPLQENSPAISASYTLSRFYNTSVTVFPFSPKFKPGCVAKKHSPVLSLIILMLFSPESIASHLQIFLISTLYDLLLV